MTLTFSQRCSTPQVIKNNLVFLISPSLKSSLPSRILLSITNRDHLDSPCPFTFEHSDKRKANDWLIRAVEIKINR